MTEKYKILTISDHPLVPSGVGTQTKYLIEGLLKTGRYQFRSLGAAIKHSDYRPVKIQEYGDDWIIHPIDGYANENMIREILEQEKFDGLWFFTDPRFYLYLFNMSDEVRDRGIPMFYWTIWDDEPTPRFNKPFYNSCDFLGCISKITHRFVKELVGEEKCDYIPHSVNESIFKMFSEEDRQKFKKDTFKAWPEQKFVIFYNSRNARRKCTSDVIKTYKQFSDIVGKDKTFLLMHCDPHDPEGANLYEVCKCLDVSPDQIAFSSARVPPEQLAIFYNVVDVTVCLSNNEGFGLSSLESLMCGTPVISVRTGGLQDQNIMDDGTELCSSIVPCVRNLTGSQDIPTIFADFVTDKEVVDSLLKLYNMSKEQRSNMSKMCAEHALKKFPMSKMIEKWDFNFTKYIEQYRINRDLTRIKFKKI